MFDKNWNILIGVLVIVLVFAYFRNCSEGFAVSNDEAIANVAALYNKDNMSVTNLTTTGAFNSRFKNDTWIPYTDGINYIRGPTRLEGQTFLANNIWHSTVDGKYRFHFGANGRTYFGSQNGYEWRNAGDGTIMTLENDGTLKTGGIASPTIDWLHNRIAALEGNAVQYNHMFWIRAGDRNLYNDSGRTWIGDGNDGTWWMLRRTK